MPTKQQKIREAHARVLDRIAGGGGTSAYARQARRVNRRVDMKKGRTRGLK